MNESGCWVAFLRAINVGGRKVTMDDLRQLLADLDLGTVSTFIASGNVIFEGASGDEASIATRVEAALAAGLGYGVETFVRPIKHIAGLVAAPVFEPAEGVAVHVGFFRHVPDASGVQALYALAGPEDQLEFRQRELWWRREGRVSDSPLATAALGRALGQPTTLRTLRTLERISQRHPR
jgi:uncharacterized protein (DUF1697 family)